MCVAICGETVIHSERFVMKEDLEGMHFNGEGRGGGRNESSRSPSLPPAASIYQHRLCSRAELMPICCTQTVGNCIDACACFSLFILFSDSTAAPEDQRMTKLGISFFIVQEDLCSVLFFYLSLRRVGFRPLQTQLS